MRISESSLSKGDFKRIETIFYDIINKRFGRTFTSKVRSTSWLISSRGSRGRAVVLSIFLKEIKFFVFFRLTD